MCLQGASCISESLLHVWLAHVMIFGQIETRSTLYAIYACADD